MNSHTLLNISKAITRVRAHGWQGSFHTNLLMDYLVNFGLLDEARKLFYSHDPSSQAIFDWRIQHLVTQDFYGGDFPYELENAPFSKAAWQELEKQAQSMTSGFVKNDYLLDRINTWILESYTLPGICEAAPGDIVIDCGAYTGSTTLYFSQKTGLGGHVYGFEAARDVFSQYLENIRHITNCTPIRSAVSRENGTATFGGNPACASLGQPGEEVTTVALDDFISKNNIPRVDFIKMDVEGAEADVLLGAAKLIRRFRPKMALSIYHKKQDLYDLPAIVRKIDPNYNFRLRHYSNRASETVVFCTPDTEPAPPADCPISDKEQAESLQTIFDFLVWMHTARSHRQVVMREYYTLLRQYEEDCKSMAATTDTLIRKNKELSVENIALKRLTEKMSWQTPPNECNTA